MAKPEPDICNVCWKSAEHGDKFNPFVIAIVRGQAQNPQTGRMEPVIRDGVFDANGKLALLKACPSCGPKVKRFLDTKDLEVLPDGHFKKMMGEIAARQRLEDLKLH